MSIVEEAYREAVDAMTPAERIERMVNLNAWAREVIERTITAEQGQLSPDELKWRVALRIYGSNLHSRQLIEEALTRVSN